MFFKLMRGSNDRGLDDQSLNKLVWPDLGKEQNIDASEPVIVQDCPGSIQSPDAIKKPAFKSRLFYC
jgi:hypothetical protein